MGQGENPPVCDYEGSDYQTRFWEKGDRAYEDGCEAIALDSLLPKQGSILLELGAGAGRNTMRYKGYSRIVLMDYSRTQIQQAQQRLGRSSRFTYVVADIYRLPFLNELFDAATMIRVLHHMADAPGALKEVRRTLQPGAFFLLEYANKRNLKAILRFTLHRQEWDPFSLEPVEFAPLNFDFHPQAVMAWLTSLDFTIERTRTVSHFRVGFLKRIIPTRILIWMDALLQWTGTFIQLTPSIFLGARLSGQLPVLGAPKAEHQFFKCPKCGFEHLDHIEDHLHCDQCTTDWPIEDGIYIFKTR